MKLIFNNFQLDAVNEVKNSFLRFGMFGKENKYEKITELDGKLHIFGDYTISLIYSTEKRDISDCVFILSIVSKKVFSTKEIYKSNISLLSLLPFKAKKPINIKLDGNCIFIKNKM